MSKAIRLIAKPVTDAIYDELKISTKNFITKTNHKPSLATVLVGDDSASQIYIKKKGEMCISLGFDHKDFKLDKTVSQQELESLVNDLNHDNSIDGILVQSPLPKHLNEIKIYDLLLPEKDVDCFSPKNVGLLSQGRARLLPCTPAGVMEILKFYKINPTGMNAVVLGRSDIVGKPMAMLLTQANATVTIAHSKTSDLNSHLERADLIVAAIGKSKFIDSKFKLKSDAILIDVGINRLQSGGVVGDIDTDYFSSKVKCITPVPGGVGPMTIAMLMVNTFRAASNRKGLPILI